MAAKPFRHIPDVVHPGYTYCGRKWAGRSLGGRIRVLFVIDLARDCIEDAECKTCQRSDDRRTREAYTQEVHEKAIAQRAKTAALRAAKLPPEADDPTSYIDDEPSGGPE